MLVVAHRLSTIARVERIIVLEDGNIAESGTYRQLVGFSDTCFEVVHERLTEIIVQVNKEGSRFRHLVGAQLNAVAGEYPTSALPPATLPSERTSVWEAGEHREARV